LNLFDINLFNNVEKSIVDLIPRYASIKLINPKESIVYEDDIESSNMYILNAGVVMISKTDSQGNEKALSLKKAGEVFGYLSIIDQAPRNSRAIALINSKYWVIDGSFVQNVLLKDAQFNLNLMKVYTSYIRNYDDNNSPAHGKTAQKKLLFQMLKIGDISNESCLCTINSYISQTVMSSFAGLARETVSREINKLKLMEILVIDDQHNMHLNVKKAETILLT
jgi:CRP-like cAMP-binding protein